MKRMIDTLSSIVQTIATIAMVGAFLWLIGAVDAGTMARMGATHARIANSTVGAVGGAWSAIPWRFLGSCLLLIVLIVALAATWSHIKRIYMLNRSVKIEMLD